MRRLLGRANSSNVMKVIWLLEELGIPYERVDFGGPFGGTATPEYRAMNPNGTIPILIEDEFVLWESNAILRYLGAAHSTAHSTATSIWPIDVRARAGVDRWMDWQQTNLTRPQTVVFQGVVRTQLERRDTGAIEAAMVELRRAWTLLDTVLAQTQYVAGPDFTLADIAIGVHVHRWLSFPVSRPETPHLHAWYRRLLTRPAYVQHVAQPMS